MRRMRLALVFGCLYKLRTPISRIKAATLVTPRPFDPSRARGTCDSGAAEKRVFRGTALFRSLHQAECFNSNLGRERPIVTRRRTGYGSTPGTCALRIQSFG